MRRKKTNNNKNVHKKNILIHRKTINTNKSDFEKNDKLIHVFVTMRFNNVLPAIHEKKNIKFSFCIFSADIRKLYHQTLHKVYWTKCYLKQYSTSVGEAVNENIR